MHLQLSGGSPGAPSRTPALWLLLAQDQCQVTARRSPHVTVRLTGMMFTGLSPTETAGGGVLLCVKPVTPWSAPSHRPSTFSQVRASKDKM